MNKYVFWTIVTIELIVIIAAVIMRSEKGFQDSSGSAVYKEDEMVASVDDHEDDAVAADREDELTGGSESDAGESSEISDQEEKTVDKQEDEPVDVVDAREILKDHPECIDLYRKALSQIDYKYGMTKGYYLLDVNGDDIPELMVYDDDCHAGQVDFFTVYNGELISLGAYGENGKVYLNPEAHIVEDNYWQGGGGYLAYFDILRDKSVFRGSVGLVERCVEKLVSGDKLDWYSYTEYYLCDEPHDQDNHFEEKIDQKKYNELLSEYSDDKIYECYDVKHYYAFGLEENLDEMLDRFIKAAEKSPERETVENAIASYESFLKKDKLYEHFKRNPDAENPMEFKAYLDYLDDDDIPELFVMGRSGSDETGVSIFTYDPENERIDQIGEFFSSWYKASYIPREGMIAGIYDLNADCDLDVIIQIDKNGSHVVKYYYRDGNNNYYEVYHVNERNTGTVGDIDRINIDIDKKYLVESGYYYKKTETLLKGDNVKKLIFNGYNMPIISNNS